MKREQENIVSQELALTEIMLEFVRAAVLGRDPVVPHDIAIDWNRLMDISTEQGLIAWVWDGICRLPKEQQPPRRYRINWGMSAQEIWDRYVQQKNVLRDIVEKCEQNNMQLLLLKGIGLSELYPKPQSRPSGDLDLYFFEDYEKGNYLFGDGVNHYCKKHASFDYHGVHIENHLMLIDSNTEFERKIGEYLQADLVNVCLTSNGYYVFSPITNLIYLITHSLHHFNPHQAVPLRNVLDIILFVRSNKEQLPPQQCYQVLFNLRLYSTFELFLCAGEFILGITLPEYHFGAVKQKHKKYLKDYFLSSGSKLIVSERLPKTKQLLYLFRNYRRLKYVYRYLPSRKENLFWVTYRHNLAIILKRIFQRVLFLTRFKL